MIFITNNHQNRSVVSFFEKHQRELLLNTPHRPADIAHTYARHIAFQIAKTVAHLPKGKMLVTGGGAYHKFLIEQLKQFSKHHIELGSAQLINYKEALIFAFLGVLRHQGKTNILSDYTGASSDSCSGVVWYPQ